MARMNGKSALKVLPKFLGPGMHRRLRAGAYRALGRIGAKHSPQEKALAVVEMGLSDPMPSVRRAAIDAFGVRPGRQGWSFTQDGDPRTQ